VVVAAHMEVVRLVLVVVVLAGSVLARVYP
jgi:hypothetical protein